jgi:hypothetical protein
LVASCSMMPPTAAHSCATRGRWASWCTRSTSFDNCSDWAPCP